MTSFKFLGAALVLSALVATPASAWEAISEPAAAAALNPNFSIYSGGDSGFGSSRAMVPQTLREDAAGLHMSVRPHRAHHAAKRY
ncbi:MAG TPA: hypothetical protein VKR55_24210 [Bradyrhizobium sp.]|uniref:hypothetical protein n=1 Tax=Bradyrhizobium sp. TaxID=376 RepID=UPI002CD7623F|nr:hypothetical protein [Bradyrhizobium sp.]HLZ05239.1 hypothetical protein [Bradyrhizobium sp.]